MKNCESLKDLFNSANQALITNDIDLFENKVSERTLCGALMLHIHNLIMNDSEYEDYYVDVEYNRNKGNVKTVTKTVMGSDQKIIKINCDLILHSRGKKPNQDNLIAIEMKKSNRPCIEKENDKERLIALTKDSFDDIWSFDGKTLPEHVCRYVIGIYYEINYCKRTINIEYYKKGEISEIEVVPF